MSATTKDKRERRVLRRSVPEVVEAVHVGKLSVRLADQLLYLPRGKQRTELQRRLHAQGETERRSRLAADTLKTYLATNPGRINLMELGQKIRELSLERTMAKSKERFSR
jgi:hypothetical protein